jgi:hypothetical protein
MVDYEKIKQLQVKISKNRDKMINEKEYKKKEILRLKIQIDELKIKLEKLK